MEALRDYINLFEDHPFGGKLMRLMSDAEDEQRERCLQCDTIDAFDRQVTELRTQLTALRHRLKEYCDKWCNSGKWCVSSCPLWLWHNEGEVVK